MATSKQEPMGLMGHGTKTWAFTMGKKPLAVQGIVDASDDNTEADADAEVGTRQDETWPATRKDR